MGVNYQQLMAVQRRGLRVDYAGDDTIFYALSVGAGRRPDDETGLSLVYEGRGLQALPSMATVLMRAPVVESGLDLAGLIHLEQRLRISAPLPAAGPLIVDAGVSGVVDKGAGKGSIVIFESAARLPDGRPVFAAQTVMLAKNDGGIGGGGAPLPPPLAALDGEPDHVVPVPIGPEQALLYRLNEDRNPLHVDPEVARKAGFPRPILHGLCTYGAVCHALVATLMPGEPQRLRSLDARFTAPVFPGDALELDVWVEGAEVRFRCRATGRQTVVLDRGHAVCEGLQARGR